MIPYLLDSLKWSMLTNVFCVYRVTVFLTYATWYTEDVYRVAFKIKKERRNESFNCVLFL